MPEQFKQNILDQYEPEKLPVGWPWKFFTFSLAIFLAMALAYLGLIFGYEPYLNSQIEKRGIELSQLAQTVSKTDQENFIKFYSQLVNLKNILNNHVIPSKIFPFLERVTNQKVYYTDANFKISEQILELSGIAASYAVLAEQLEAFDQSAELKRYVLNQAQASENTVQFKVTLTLKDNLLK